MATHTAKIEGVPVKDLRTVTLAHPLRTADMKRLGFPGDEPAEVGDRVKVLPDHAATLINAGYAAVDPEDPDAVRAVLHPETDDDEDVKAGTDARAADSQTAPTGTAAGTPSQSGKSST